MELMRKYQEKINALGTHSTPIQEAYPQPVAQSFAPAVEQNHFMGDSTPIADQAQEPESEQGVYL
jgi:hypothetical protein